MIELKVNILNAFKGIICHQVNCRGAMGAGLAKLVAQKYPKVYEEYKQLCNSSKPQQLLGTIQICKVNEDLYVCNIFGQDRYGTFKQQTNYNALKTAIDKLIKVANEQYPDLQIYIPKGMGCKLGGGDWNVVRKLIENIPKLVLVEYPNDKKS